MKNIDMALSTVSLFKCVFRFKTRVKLAVYVDITGLQVKIYKHEFMLESLGGVLESMGLERVCACLGLGTM